MSSKLDGILASSVPSCLERLAALQWVCDSASLLALRLLLFLPRLLLVFVRLLPWCCAFHCWQHATGRPRSAHVHWIVYSKSIIYLGIVLLYRYGTTIRLHPLHRPFQTSVLSLPLLSIRISFQLQSVPIVQRFLVLLF